jgi:drug/metabolite transporter (DMT)-like permease
MLSRNNSESHNQRNNVETSSQLSSSAPHPKWKILLYGQFIALSLTCCSASSSTLQKLSGIKNMPLFQIAGGYFFLGLLYVLQLKREVGGEMTERLKHQNKDDHDLLESERTRLLSNFTKIHYDLENPVAATSLNCQKVPRFHLPIFHNIKLHSPWYFYTLLAFLDVQANYFVILSFRYTTLINTNLLTSISVVSVMTSSKIILKRVFRIPHFIGVSLVLLGTSFIVSSDFKDGDTITTSIEHHEFSNMNNYQHIQGDAFAIIAALLFGLNDTLAEYCIKNATINEYLAMMGIFGFLFSMCESMIFESHQVLEFIHLVLRHLTGSIMTATNTTVQHNHIDPTTAEEILDKDVNLSMITTLWIIYTFCLVFFYTSASYFLQIADATLLSLSLQSSNMWTMMFSILVQHIYPVSLFYIAVVLVFVGVWIYEKGTDCFL